MIYSIFAVKLYMKTFLVPVDFSDTSKNAARYAAQLSASIQDAEIILYNASDKVVSISEGNDGSRKAISDNELKILKDELNKLGSTDITFIAEEGSFVSNLVKYVESHKVDLVIMGITGNSRLTQIFMGTNTLNVIRHIKTPVMVIPAEAKFSSIKNVLLTSDFKDVANTTPFDEISNILDLFNPTLHIVNVDSEHYIELTETYKTEKAVMVEKLGKFNPEFSFLRIFDFLDGVNTFVQTKNIDAILTVPKKHNFLAALFQVSNTKKLAYHSHVPIIAVHK